MGEINSERFESADENQEIVAENSETLEFDVAVEVSVESPRGNDDQPGDDRTSDNQASTVIPSNAESPAMARGSAYQMLSQSMCLLAQNAVNAQKQLTTTQQTATTQELQQFIGPKPQPSPLNSQNSLENLQGIIAILTSLSK